MLVVILHKGVNYGFYIVYTPKSTQAKSKVYLSNFRATQISCLSPGLCPWHCVPTVPVQAGQNLRETLQVAEWHHYMLRFEHSKI
jgi:hypothetical protein